MCCCTRSLKENEGMPDASSRFGIGKPMLIEPRFYHIQEIRGKNRSRQWSPRGQKLYLKTLFAPGLRPSGSLQCSPGPASWWGGGSQSPPQELHPASALRFTIDPLEKKSCGRPCASAAHPRCLLLTYGGTCMSCWGSHYWFTVSSLLSDKYRTQYATPV